MVLFPSFSFASSSVLLNLLTFAGQLQFAHSASLPFINRASTNNVGFQVKTLSTAASSSQAVGGSIGVNDSSDALYTVDIVLGGKAFTVQLDTGSTDLWVAAPNATLQLTNSTSLNISATYGTGTVSGFIQFAELQIGQYTVPSQVFINVDQADSGQRQFLSDGVDGIMGMAFLDDTASSIFDAIDQAWGSGSTSLANSVPVNIFAQNSSAPDFFDINLSRDIDLDGNTLGLFAISEHIPGFENVTQTPKLYRQNPDRWAIAMDSLQVNGQAFTFNKSSLSTIPAGKVGAVLDTGASLPQLPGPAIDFIYGSIPGALSDGDIGWIVPCYGTTNLTLTFGGQAIPIHPLDLTYIDFFVDPTSGMNITICRNAYNALSLGPNFTGFDLLLGDSFLRNVYASFDFGDAGTTNNSFIQLLPTTDPSAAWTEFVLARAETLAGLPPIADPPVLELLIEYETNSTSSDNSTSTGDAGDPTDSLSGAIQNDDTTNSTPSSNYQTTDSNAVNLLDKYGPVVVGLLAGNILISLLLLIVGLVACTRGWMRKGARSAPSYVPVRLKEAAMAEDMDYRSSTSYNRP